MKTKIGLWALAYIFTLYACFEDKGNYNYVDTNLVNIELTAQDAVMGKEYVLHPGLTFSIPEDSLKFEYRWEVDSKEACLGRDFKYTFTGIGAFQVGYFVKELKTQMTTTYFFRVNVISPYGMGWVVLSEKDSRSALSMIRPEKYNENGIEKKRYVDYVDLYKTLHKDELGSDPIKLGQSFTWDNSLLFVMQRGGEGCVELNGVEYKKDIRTEKEFVGEVYPPAFVPAGVVYASPLEGILSANGDFYTRVRTDMDLFHTCAYSNEPTYYDGVKLKIDQLILPLYTSSNFFFLYEGSKKRFLAMKTQKFANAGMFLNIIPETGVSDFTSLSNIGDYELLYGSAYGESTNKSYFVNILKNGTDIQMQTFLAATTSTTSTLNITESKQLDLSGIRLNGSPSGTSMNEQISLNTVFHMLRTRPYLFFAEAGILYYYDMNMKQYRKYHDFGVAVTAMASNPQKSELGVGLANGDFYIFDISDAVFSSGVSKELHIQNGLGRVVDVMYKFDSENTYASQKAD